MPVLSPSLSNNYYLIALGRYSCGQSYKRSKIIIYEATIILLTFFQDNVVMNNCRTFLRLATDYPLYRLRYLSWEICNRIVEIFLAIYCLIFTKKCKNNNSFRPKIWQNCQTWVWRQNLNDILTEEILISLFRQKQQKNNNSNHLWGTR